MSQKAVEQLIGRLMTDAGFRERAAHELDAACREEGYDLSDAELRIVASLDFRQVAQMGELWLDDRIKRFVPAEREKFQGGGAGKEEQGRKMGQIIARAWNDSAFKQRLLTDTVEVLKAEGLEIPAGIKVQALENTDRVFHFVLPPKPATGQQPSDEQLDAAAGGGWLKDVCASFMQPCGPGD